MRRAPRFTFTEVLSLAVAIMLIVVCYAAATRAAPKMSPFGRWLTHAGEAKMHGQTRDP
jgi:hypothetical protein